MLTQLCNIPCRGEKIITIFVKRDCHHSIRCVKRFLWKEKEKEGHERKTTSTSTSTANNLNPHCGGVRTCTNGVTHPLFYFYFILFYSLFIYLFFQMVTTNLKSTQQYDFKWWWSRCMIVNNTLKKNNENKMEFFFFFFGCCCWERKKQCKSSIFLVCFGGIECAQWGFKVSFDYFATKLIIHEFAHHSHIKV